MFALLSNKLNKEKKVGKERAQNHNNYTASITTLLSGTIDTNILL